MIVAALVRVVRRLLARGARAVLVWSEPAAALPGPASAPAPVRAGPPPAWVALVADAAPELLDGIEPAATLRSTSTARPTVRAQPARIGAGLRAGPLRFARTVMSGQRGRPAQQTPNGAVSPQDDPTSDRLEPRFSRAVGSLGKADDRTAFNDNNSADRAASGANGPARLAPPGRRAGADTAEDWEPVATAQPADVDAGQAASERRPVASQRRGGVPVFAPPRESGETVPRLNPSPANHGRPPASRLASSAQPPFARAAAAPDFPLVVERHVSDPEWPELPVSVLTEEAGPWTSLPESQPAVSRRRRPFADRWRAELTAE